METTYKLPRITPPNGLAKLAGLLPLVMLALGFIAGPGRPLPGLFAWLLIYGSVGAAAVMLWKRWMPVDLALYGAVFWVVRVVMDEVPAAYDVPFMLVLTGILLLGALGFVFSPSRWIAWLFLAGAGVFAYLLAGQIANRFWGVFCTDTFDACLHCVENFAFCKPEVQQSYPWWRFILGR